MNTKILIQNLAKRMQLSVSEVEELLEATTFVIKTELSKGKNIGITSFGSFEIRKKDERLSVHPTTQIRTFIPPKLVVCFKQSNILKEKINEKRL